MPRATALLALGLFCLSWTVYLFTPFAIDIFVFWGASRLADIQYGGGWHGILESWELKPFMNRLFFYLIYWLSMLAYDPQNKALFPLIIKLAYLPFVFIAGLCLAGISRVFFKRNAGVSFDKPDAFAHDLACLALLPLTSFGVFLQPEYTALLFTLVGMFLLLRENRLWIFLGAAFLAMVPFFKLVTLVFVVQALAALWLFFGWSLKKTALLSCLTLGLSLLLLGGVGLLYPQELQDMLDAPAFHAATIQPFMKIIGNLTWKGLGMLFLNLPLHPLIAPSLLALGFGIRRSGLLSAESIGIVVFWLASWFVIAIQGHFYSYHFASLYLAMHFSMLLGIKAIALEQPFRMNSLAARFSAACITVSIALFLLFASPLENRVFRNPHDSFYNPNSILDYKNQQKKVNNEIKTADIFSLLFTQNDKALYLCTGVGVWLTDMQSASRYFFPLPLKGVRNNPDIALRECHRNVLQTMNSFDGDFILHNPVWMNWNAPWFAERKQDIAPFLENLRAHYQAFPLRGYVLYIRRGL